MMGYLATLSMHRHGREALILKKITSLDLMTSSAMRMAKPRTVAESIAVVAACNTGQIDSSMGS